MKSLSEFINESIICEAKDPKKVLDANYEKQGYIDDILYAWDIANKTGWKSNNDDAYFDLMKGRDDVSKSDAKRLYLSLIKAVTTMGKDASKTYIEDNWGKELKSYCLPWE